MIYARWVPEELRKPFGGLNIPSLESDQNLLIKEKLLGSNNIKKPWKTLKSCIEERGLITADESVDRFLFFYLCDVVKEGLYLPRYEAHTPKEREQDMEKVKSLVKKLKRFINTYHEDVSLFNLLSINVYELMLENKEFGDALNLPSLFERYTEIEDLRFPSLIEILENLVKAVEKKANQTPILLSPNVENFKEIYFIRKLYLRFQTDFGQPLYCTIENLGRVFIGEGVIDYTYVRERIMDYIKILNK